MAVLILLIGLSLMKECHLFFVQGIKRRQRKLVHLKNGWSIIQNSKLTIKSMNINWSCVLSSMRTYSRSQCSGAIHEFWFFFFIFIFLYTNYIRNCYCNISTLVHYTLIGLYSTKCECCILVLLNCLTWNSMTNCFFSTCFGLMYLFTVTLRTN